MDELGITVSGLDRVIKLVVPAARASISFLTAGPDECRAWPIPDGSTAVDAAAAIHTDLAKGFIRAETCATRTCCASARWPRRARPASSARREDLPGARRGRRRDPVQPLRRRLAGRPVSSGAARVEVDDDRA
jgi:hypothetical protein